MFLCDKNSDQCSEPWHKEAARSAFFSVFDSVILFFMLRVCILKSRSLLVGMDSTRHGGVPV